MIFRYKHFVFFLFVAAALLLSKNARSAVVLSEVMSLTGATVIDEYVELYNNGNGAVDVSGYHITDGDAVDSLIAWGAAGDIGCASCVTNTTSIPAGSYVLILNSDYDTGAKPYSFPSGTIILRPGGGSTNVGNGLATDDPVTLNNETGTAISTFGTPAASTAATFDNADDDVLDSLPYDDGATYHSWLKINVTNANDGDAEWDNSNDCVSGGISPGAANTICDDKIIITEVLSNADTANEDKREFIELYNNGSDEINLTQYRFTDGGGLDQITGWNQATHGTIVDTDVVYDATTLEPGEYGLILDPDYETADDQDAIDFPPDTKIFTTANVTSLGGSFDETDPVTLYNGVGLTVDTYGQPTASNRRTFANADASQVNIPDDREITDNRSVERVATVVNGVVTYHTTDVWANDWQLGTDFADWSPGWHSTTSPEDNQLSSSVVSNATVSVGAANRVAMAFTYTNTKGNPMQYMRLVNMGTMTNSDVSAVHVYHDAGTQGTYDGADTLLCTMTNLTSTSWSCGSFSVTSGWPLLITLDIANGATSGRTFKAAIPHRGVKSFGHVFNILPGINQGRLTVQ